MNSYEPQTDAPPEKRRAGRSGKTELDSPRIYSGACLLIVEAQLALTKPKKIKSYFITGFLKAFLKIDSCEPLTSTARRDSWDSAVALN